MPPSKRDEDICTRYLTKGISAQTLAMETGLSVPRIRQILKDGNVVGQPRTPQVEGADETVSADHVRIGKKLSIFRMSVLGSDRPFIAKKLNWSHVKVAHVENGIFNLTLIDLQDLCRVMETNLSNLLAEEIKS